MDRRKPNANECKNCMQASDCGRLLGSAQNTEEFTFLHVFWLGVAQINEKNLSFDFRTDPPD